VTNNIVPDLNAIGVEAVDDGICEDTFENRRLLREAKMKWRIVDGGGDSATGLIEAVHDANLEAGNQARFDRLQMILVDQTDPWSDYVPADEYPIDMVGIPYWVHRRVEKHNVDKEAGKNPASWTELPTRCKHVKRDGTRCWAWCFDRTSNGRCRMHAPGAALAENMGVQLTAARVKIMQALPAMADQLEDLALHAASEQVKLKATTEMMDRAGLRGGAEIEISGQLTTTADPSIVLRERLDTLRERLEPADETITVEVLEEKADE
jgi:hypothetical protein